MPTDKEFCRRFWQELEREIYRDLELEGARLDREVSEAHERMREIRRELYTHDPGSEKCKCDECSEKRLEKLRANLWVREEDYDIAALTVESARRLGIGRRLLEHAIRYLEQWYGSEEAAVVELLKDRAALIPDSPPGRPAPW